VQPAWELQQQHTFLAWVNAKLKRLPAAKQVATLADLSDGVALCQLLEVLWAPQKLPRWNPAPRMDAQRLDNLSVFFTALESSGLHVLTKPRNVLEGNVPMVLGLLWHLIYEYEITRTVKVAASAAAAAPKGATDHSLNWSRPDPRDALLDWLNNRIERSGVKARALDAGSFQDGNVLLALTHSFGTDSFDLRSMMRMNSPEKIRVAFSTAQSRFGIAVLLDERALLNGECDEKSLMTYVIQFLRYEQEVRSTTYQQAQFQQQQQQHQPQQLVNPYSGGNLGREAQSGDQVYPYVASAPPPPPPPYSQPPPYSPPPPYAPPPPSYASQSYQQYPPQYPPQYAPPQQHQSYAAFSTFQTVGYQPYVYEPPPVVVTPAPPVYLNAQPTVQYVGPPQYVVVKHKGKKYKHKKYKGGKKFKGGKRFGFGFKGFKF
jgi:hypothetical protein